jgi:hypothetical protein
VQDSRIVDDGVHPADRVDLPGNVTRLFQVRQVAHHGCGPAVHQILNGIQPGSAPGMDNNIVPALQKGPRRSLSQTVSRPGDKNPHA